jgi:hypothetical protein
MTRLATLGVAFALTTTLCIHLFINILLDIMPSLGILSALVFGICGGFGGIVLVSTIDSALRKGKGYDL